MTDLWLEKELIRQLTPVAAPESLWGRINQRQLNEDRRLGRAFWPAVVVGAAMVVLALAGVLRTAGSDRDPDKLAEQELAAVTGAARGFDFRSESFDDTRAWVKAEADIDIDVPLGRSAPNRGDARLLGARLIRLHGLQVAAIDYRVDDGTATLFVTGKRAGLTGNTQASRHLFSRTKSAGDALFFSWNMRSESYTIAFPGAKISRGACLLCHATTPS